MWFNWNTFPEMQFLFSYMFPPSIPPSPPPSPRSDCFNKQPAHFNANLICFPKRHRVSIFSSPFHAWYLQQWWRWACFFEWRLLVPAQLFSDEADFSHISEVLGRKQYPVVKFMQGARQQGGERKMSPCHGFSKSPCNPPAKSCDNRNDAAVCTKMPEARPQCQLCTLCLQQGMEGGRRYGVFHPRKADSKLWLSNTQLAYWGQLASCPQLMLGLLKRLWSMITPCYVLTRWCTLQWTDFTNVMQQ